MPNYMFIYHGGKTPETPEEGEKTMAAWMAWMEEVGDAWIDRGAPAGMSMTVFADRTTEDGGANPVTGYSLVTAASQKAACDMARGCPLVADGGSVEVAEAIQM